MLERAIAGVGPVVRETIVVARQDGPREVPDGVMVVRDTRPFEGPLVGLLAGLRRATQPVILLVGGDMPTMVKPVLEALLAELADPRIDAATLEHDGRGRPLPGALRAGPALAVAERLVAGGERSLRAVYRSVNTAVIGESTWRALDPGAHTLRDVDTPADLP